jgi:AhpD family alkylhydroperoxidase
MIGRQLAARTASRQVRFVEPVPAGPDSPLRTEVLRRVERDLPFVVPPLLAHTPSPPALAACWMLMHATLFAGTATDRMTREAVAAAVSVANRCPYCAEFHALGVRGLGAGGPADAILADRPGTIADPRLRAAVDWAGAARHPSAPAAPAAELIGTLVTFEYLCRMVNVFLPNYLLPPGLPGGARRGLAARIAGLMGPMLRRPVDPDAALDLLPPAPLPADLAWAAGSAHLATALARATAALEALGERAVPAPVRRRLAEELVGWDGTASGPGRGWLAPALAPLSGEDEPSGRLVLLTAFGSTQLRPEDVAEYRAGPHTDADLVELLAWAAFRTARTIGGWQSVRDDHR